MVCSLVLCKSGFYGKKQIFGGAVENWIDNVEGKTSTAEFNSLAPVAENDHPSTALKLRSG
jgi:hypothetical protein